MPKRLVAVFMSTFVHGPRSRARMDYGQNELGIPNSPPEEVKIRDHWSRFLPWERSRLSKPLTEDGVSEAQSYNGRLMFGSVFIVAPLAGLFAFCVAEPRRAYDGFIQRPIDGIYMRLPSGMVSPDTIEEIKERKKALSHYTGSTITAPNND